MDDRLRIFFWAVAGGGLLGAFGLLFGALTGVLTRLDGRAAGGFIGRTVLQAIARTSERPLLPTTAAGIVGAAEGAVFLGLVGVVLGMVVGYQGEWSESLGIVLGSAGALLLLGALLFGSLAYGLTWLGARAAGLVCAGGILGALAGGRLAGEGDGLLLGALIGVIGGIVLSVVLRTAGRKPHPPNHGADAQEEGSAEPWE